MCVCVCVCVCWWIQSGHMGSSSRKYWTLKQKPIKGINGLPAGRVLMLNGCQPSERTTGAGKDGEGGEGTVAKKSISDCRWDGWTERWSVWLIDENQREFVDCFYVDFCRSLIVKKKHWQIGIDVRIGFNTFNISKVGIYSFVIWLMFAFNLRYLILSCLPPPYFFSLPRID